jgi:hypothetical protein
MDKSLKIALGSLGVSLVVLAVKFTAYLITGSLALYSMHGKHHQRGAVDRGHHRGQPSSISIWWLQGL